jgi:para-aminobenzoate synthetase component 1
MSRLPAIFDRTLSAEARPVVWPADLERVFAYLAREAHSVWLDSAGGPTRLARWSVLAAAPSAVLVHEGGASRLLDAGGRPLGGDLPAGALDALRQVLAAASVENGPAGLPFGPGFYGYLAYDLAPEVESKAILSPRRDIPLPEMWLGLYETVLVVDRAERRATLVGGRGPGREAIEAALASAAGAFVAEKPAAAPLPAELTCNFTRDAYLQAVRRAREYIAAGDIYQVNLSRRFTAALDGGDAPAGLADLYLRLRRANPAPYAAYVGLGAGRAVLSSSPELFLELAGGRVLTRPIKGTRPRRPGDAAFNRRMRRDLLASPKDRAELVMIVDLERNDLGRVCSYGSIRVAEPRAVEAYAAVYHTVATVEGRLHPDRTAVDLVRATFPGGSITGAPKVRAMQIIAELEPTRRSVYTGAVGFLGPRSAAESAGRCVLNIAIRTLLADWPRVHLQVGGGIVADSEPEAEFDETTDKARAMLAALGLQAGQPGGPP